MKEMKFRCQGCTEVCSPIPVTFSYLMSAISNDDSNITKTALSILHGILVPVHCQREQKLMLVPLGVGG